MGKLSRSGIFRLAIVAVTIVISGCDSLNYYRQAVSGHLQLLQQRQPISALLQNHSIPANTRERLQLVQELRDFAAKELQLPVAQHYDSYVELGRDFVVWNVFAAPEFSLQLQNWCFPIAGCVNYRGYFAETAALQQASLLQAQQLETWVGGVTAYSTLGWFDDPVLSSMLRRDDGQLAGLLFHELAHQRVYAKGDTAFNESFATAVEQEGQRRWLENLSAPRREVVALAIEQARARQQAFVALVQQGVGELAELYAEDLTDAVRRDRKMAIQQKLRSRYELLKAQWNGYSGYDQWFAGPLNNAQLGTVTTYNQWVGVFQKLLSESDGDLTAFYQQVAALASMPNAHRQQRLRELSAIK